MCTKGAVAIHPGSGLIPQSVMRLVPVRTSISMDELTSDDAAAEGWSYQGKTGPRYWHSLSESFKTCELGLRQSPIDITGHENDSGARIKFMYDTLPVAVNSNGRTITVWYEPGSAMEVEGNVFQLLQAHFHAPSEHLIEGRQFSAEVHLLHENGQGAMAVVAVMLEPGNPNEAINGLLTGYDSGDAPYGDYPALHSRILEPSGKGYYNYVGSTTTPPCLEPVEWFVMTDPSTISEDQLADLYSVTSGPNNRPIQPLNGRKIRCVV